jgi:hypothetical protein
MKISLKQLCFDNLKFTKCQTNLGTIYNLNDPLQFQTPCVKIVEISNDYITLELLPTQACRLFYTKICEFESKLKSLFKKEIVSLFENSVFKVKIKNNKNFNIYFENSLFNFYHLKPEMNAILLISINKLWENGIINYHLNVNEMVLKKSV